MLQLVVKDQRQPGEARLTIESKLALGIGSILGFLMLNATAIYFAAERVNGLVTAMSRMDEPASMAAQQMETDLAETGLALKTFLQNPSPEAIESLRNGEKQFRKSQAAYRAAAPTSEAKRLGDHVERAYAQYLAMGEELIRLSEQHAASLENHLRLERSLHDLLQRRTRFLTGSADASAKLAVLDLGLNAHKLGLDLIGFLRSRDPHSEARVHQSARDFAEILDRYHASGLGPEEERWAAELRRVFADAVAQMAQLIEQEKRKQSAWTGAIGARLAVDALLDDELQEHLRFSLAKTKQELLDAGRQSVFLVLVMLLTAVLASVAAGVATARSIARPLRHLLSVVEATGRGDLTRQVAVTSNDEVGQIARAFNRLAEDLRRTTVSRAYVEGVVRGMTESLVVVSTDGAIETVNPAVCALLGHRETELVGRPFDAVVADWPALAGQAAKALVHDHETEYRTKDGRRVPVLFSADRLHLGDRDAGFVCVALDMTELNRSREELAASREHLRELAGHLNTSIEADRARIAREVHDQLGQAMTGFKFDLHWLGRRLEHLPGGAEAALGERIAAMSRLVDDTIRVVRRIATELRPAVLDDLGLGPALEILAEQFRARTGIACEADLRTEAFLTSRQATALYRCAQEALTNVARHAGAGEVRLLLRAEVGSVLLDITDDGRGMERGWTTAQGSLGLLGMRERARELGGTVAVESAPGKGTTVRISVPLAPEAGERPRAPDRGPPPTLLDRVGEAVGAAPATAGDYARCGS